MNKYVMAALYVLALLSTGITFGARRPASNCRR